MSALVKFQEITRVQRSNVKPRRTPLPTGRLMTMHVAIHLQFPELQSE